jgi:hypothetical protein
MFFLSKSRLFPVLPIKFPGYPNSTFTIKPPFAKRPLGLRQLLQLIDIAKGGQTWSHWIGNHPNQF